MYIFFNEFSVCKILQTPYGSTENSYIYFRNNELVKNIAGQKVKAV